MQYQMESPSPQKMMYAPPPHQQPQINVTVQQRQQCGGNEGYSLGILN